MDFDIGEIVVDTFKSVAEANVLPLSLLSSVGDLDDDPQEALTGIANVVAPAIGNAQSIAGAFSTKPNLDGAGGLPIIAAALATLGDMQDQCGKGSPDQGGDFLDGASLFRGISETFSGTGPPESWQGAGSDAYRQANHHQQLRADAMAAADAKVQEALQAEAEDVLATRQVINDAVQFLNTCIPIGNALAAPMIGSDSASYGFQIAAVAKVMPGALSRLDELTKAVTGYASQITDAAGIYDNVKTDDGPKAADTGDRLHVLPGALRARAGDQRAVARDISAAGKETSEAPYAVAESHGTVCEPTGVALSATEVKRAAAAEYMSHRSTRLADGLRTAADWYERTDRRQQAKLMKTVQPA